MFPCNIVIFIGKFLFYCFWLLALYNCSSLKIVLIDEATAHMDVDTHLMMNNLIRTILPDTTVISIVHRTIGLEEFDWIIELSNGTIHRQGPPSAFHNLSATVISD